MILKKYLNSFLVIIFFAVIITAGISWNNFYGISQVSASSHDLAVQGYAWSDNIGWINFNPTYGGVFYDKNTGQFSGFAWSDNIGWIKFEDLSVNFNTGGESAIANTSSGVVSGWARACAGTVNNAPRQNLPGECTSMNSRTDGWDGWIKMSDDSNTNWSGKGVKIDLDSNSATKGYFSGWAWGGDVVGWISFNSKNCDSNNNGFVDINCGGDDSTTPITVSYSVRVNLTGSSSSSSSVDDGGGPSSSSSSEGGGGPSSSSSSGGSSSKPSVNIIEI